MQHHCRLVSTLRLRTHGLTHNEERFQIEASLDATSHDMVAGHSRNPLEAGEITAR